MSTLVDLGTTVQVQSVAVALRMGWWPIIALPALFLLLVLVGAFTGPGTSKGRHRQGHRRH